MEFSFFVNGYRSWSNDAIVMTFSDEKNDLFGFVKSLFVNKNYTKILFKRG